MVTKSNRLLILILLCFSKSLPSFGQAPDMPYPDLPVPGMYSQLQKMKIKEFDVWSCGDSLCLTKDLTSFMLFYPDGRIEREVYVEEDKNVPYETYTYPEKNKI